MNNVVADVSEERVSAPRNTKLFFILAFILLIFVAGMSAWYFLMGGKDIVKKFFNPSSANSTIIGVVPTYLPLDEFVVNLVSVGRKNNFVKLKIILEINNIKDLDPVKVNMPKIRDVCQLYLRGLREEDIQGGAGVERLRTELLLRINKITYPIVVNNILFDEIVTS